DIGSPDYLGLSFPFDFGGDTWGYSTNDVSQNLYYQAEVDMSGLIYGVTYYGRNIFSNYADLPLKTWVAQTDASSLSEGWQSVDDFTLLSEDTLEIGPGIMEPLFVYFDPPILFSNLSNLNFQHFLENSEWPPAFGGIWASTGEGPERVVSLLNSLEADPIDHPDFYGSHTDHAYTTFVIQPITQSANISGTAFDENNIEFESVEVNVEGQPVEAITDAIGEYSLLPLPYSSYTVTASILGYEDNVEMVELNEPEVTVDFQMIPKPQIDINALVVGSDAPSSPLDMVNISTDGYENYFSVTESNGVLLLEDVYGNAEYHITFSKYGYLDSTITVNVQDLPLDLGTIELQQEFLSPYNVTAALGADVVNVAWMDPITSVKDRFQTDSDVTWFSYTNEPNENVWLGNRFENDEPVTLQSVEVFWDIYFLEIGLVTMEILDENGEVVASSLPFETARDTLMTIDVPNVTMNGDFYVMVHWQDNPSNTHALRLDRSMGITNNAYIKYPGQTPELVSDFLGVPDGSFLVRAQVLKEGPNTGNSPLYYNIYSGAPNDMANVASWDLLNTGPIPFLDYQDVPSNNGEVMYAVEAIYEEGVSEPSFSNMLGFNVGMDDLSNIIGLKLYPNPAEGIARLELSLFQEEKIKVRILNALSQEVKSYPEVISNQMNETLDLVHLDAGIYWIEIQIGHELTTKKLALR
ncbi:MAG: T9SS type A sorting domain-containing protein, partial [Flavobacteriales bacterium]|nr:T9SS type A sorting domain-containing protein [Flavobacteriales bacterium]